MQSKFPKLAEPGFIGNLALKNRIIKAPQCSVLASPDGSVTERMIRYYKDVAQGGVSMIILEYAWIDNDASKAGPCQLGIASLEHLPGLSLLANAIQANGAKAAIQISHAGRQKFNFARPIKAPSTVPWEEMYYQGCPPPDELTFDEIKQIVKSFGDAAHNAQMAGFDMVEVHACHGYLISNFLSPRTNKRTDWYGGSLDNRLRFTLEVVNQIKSQVAPGFPVCVRVSGTDYEPDGTTIEETIQLCKRLEAMGVAAIHVSGGNHHQSIHEICPTGMSLAHNVWAAEAVKKQVKIPVIASGSITNPELAESILADGKGDFISLGRPLWADPQWPLKALSGKPQDIRPCIRCNDGCLDRGLRQARAITCSVNIAVGKEDEFSITKADRSRNVAVIGGGPAGMEAARVCALKGHNVTLYEKRQLGGALNEASIPDFKAPDLKPLIDYFATQMKELKIKVLKKEAEPQDIIDGKFDTVIVATGATSIIPEDVPGITKPHVATAVDVLRGNAKVGEKIVVVGSGIVGIEVGVFLAEQGKEVTFVEMLDMFMNGVGWDEQAVYGERLRKLKISVQKGKRLESVSDKDIHGGQQVWHADQDSG